MTTYTYNADSAEVSATGQLEKDGTTYKLVDDPWTPSEISTSLWLDASDESTITEVGVSVSEWADKSGSGNNATQTSDTYRPIYADSVVNGLNAVYSDDSSMDIPYAADMNTKEISLFAVWKNDNQTSTFGSIFLNREIIDAYRGGYYLYNYYTSTHVPRFLVGNGTGWGVYPNTAIGATDTVMNSFVITANSSAIYQHGDLEHSGSEVYAVNNSTGFSVFGLSGSLSGLKGYLCELLICPCEISTSDRQKAEGYLAWKWGTEGQLPAGHPYKDSRPVIGGTLSGEITIEITNGSGKALDFSTLAESFTEV